MRGIWVAAVVALVGCSSTPEQKKSNPLFDPPATDTYHSSFFDAPNGGPKEGMPHILKDYENEKK